MITHTAMVGAGMAAAEPEGVVLWRAFVPGPVSHCHAGSA